MGRPSVGAASFTQGQGAAAEAQESSGSSMPGARPQNKRHTSGLRALGGGALYASCVIQPRLGFTINWSSRNPSPLPLPLRSPDGDWCQVIGEEMGGTLGVTGRSNSFELQEMFNKLFKTNTYLVKTLLTEKIDLKTSKFQ